MGDRFRIGGKVYEAEAVDDISLRDLMVFNREAAPFGVTWSDIERISSEMAAAAEEAARTGTEPPVHPEALLMVGVTVWSARRAAGDDVTFEEAVDVPMAQIEWLESPKDHKPKSGKKKASPKGSVRAIDAAASESSSPTTSETSGPRSVGA